MPSSVRKSKSQKMDANVVCISFETYSPALALSSNPAGERSK